MSENFSIFTDEDRLTEARGLAAGFALIAYADAHLDPREVMRFEMLTRRDPFLEKFNDTMTMQIFERFCRELGEDYASGKEKALDAIAEAALIPGVKAPLVRIVQMAIVADEKIATQEEVMLIDIAEAAGLPLNRL